MPKYGIKLPEYANLSRSNGEEVSHENDGGEADDCPERYAPAGFLNGFVHGYIGNLIVQPIEAAPLTALLKRI